MGDMGHTAAHRSRLRGPYLNEEATMDRREILPERPVERGRGFMPGISVNPSRTLFTAGLTGRNPDGTAAGGMAAQTRRTFERLQPILAKAGAGFDGVVKQLVYVTDLDAYDSAGRAERAKFFGTARAASTGLVVRRLADPALLIEVELVVDVPGSPQGKPLLEKYNVESHGGNFYQGVIVNGGHCSISRARSRTTSTAPWPAPASGGARRRKSTRTSAICCGPPAPRRARS